jgi:hypothetical protein
MATILDLFKSKQTVGKSTEIYGLTGTTLIESRGLIDAPRAAALAASSPNAVADLIGSAASGLIGGGANRPSDTIFKDNKPFTKPISIISTKEGIRYAADDLEEAFVKTEPSPGAAMANFVKNAVSSPAQAQSAAIAALNKFGSKNGKNAFNSYINKLKKPTELASYGPKYGRDAITNKERTKTYKYSEYAPVYGLKGDDTFLSTVGLEERKLKGDGDNSKWDIINKQVLSNLSDSGKTELKKDDVDKFKTNNNELNQTYVLIGVYGKPDNNIILPGTLSGISEDFAPEINSFKYVGSPFNLYRYGGVERSLKFDLKMYYLDNDTKISMKKNLDKLRQLVFPDKNIGAVTYNNSQYSPLYFTPNLIYLTINGLYSNILGIVDTLGFTIEDNVSWGNTADIVYKSLDGTDTKPYPTVINVSFGMKIIEHPSIIQSNNQRMYNYDLSEDDGNQYDNYFTGVKNA